VPATIFSVYGPHLRIERIDDGLAFVLDALQGQDDATEQSLSPKSRVN
jgi:hypothetical protein